MIINTHVSCVCATRKTPYDYNIKLQRSGPGTMLIETKSQIRRRPVECGIQRGWVCTGVGERGWNRARERERERETTDRQRARESERI